MSEYRGYVVPKTKQPAKAVCQVMAALKNSKNANGPTMLDIIKFISGALHKPATKRQILMALKRTVEFGIIKRKKGRYQISSPDEVLVMPTESPSRKGKVTTFRESPKLHDRVMKRSSPIARLRRNKIKSSRNESRTPNHMLSPRILYNLEQDMDY